MGGSKGELEGQEGAGVARVAKSAGAASLTRAAYAASSCWGRKEGESRRSCRGCCSWRSIRRRSSRDLS